MEKVTRSLEALYKGDIRELEIFLQNNGCYDLRYTVNKDGTYWLVCSVTDEVRLLAKLRFNLAEIVDKYGTDVKFAD